MTAYRAGGLLLDTCAIIYAADGRRMSAESQRAIVDASSAGELLISAASAWEIALLSQGRGGGSLQFLPDARSWFGKVLRWPGVKATALTLEDAFESCHLPGAMHADPADRFLVATARRLGVPLVTRDKKLIAYAKQGWMKVVAC